MFYSLLLYCFTIFGERGEVPIGFSFSAGVDTKKIRSNFNSNFPQPHYGMGTIPCSKAVGITQSDVVAMGSFFLSRVKKAFVLE